MHIIKRSSWYLPEADVTPSPSILTGESSYGSAGWVLSRLFSARIGF